MKAEELCIGDWVIFPQGIDKIVDLPYIEGKGLCASFATSATLFPVPIEQLNPVPITPEILEKNGFVYNAIPFVDGWEQFGLTLYRGGNGYRIDCGINMSIIIDYVHQLQRALRLCGIEKTIEL